MPDVRNIISKIVFKENMDAKENGVQHALIPALIADRVIEALTKEGVLLDWQPIKKAKKDGTHYILADEYGSWAEGCSFGNDWFATGGSCEYSNFLGFKPTKFAMIKPPEKEYYDEH